ncbi:expressed unknown protein [Seminavis robusta]|uniref:Uncharacterized protein n=1 Tax=Seminavis robusta TaxID=568900 RepID=A0A9N8D9Y7_9STRA|nr:expressed unknown protein [Seminavis robusta]|eukprot:Sro12_g009090.1 n/a (207) ;mRNA; r:15803-16423
MYIFRRSDSMCSVVEPPHKTTISSNNNGGDESSTLDSRRSAKTYPPSRSQQRMDAFLQQSSHASASSSSPLNQSYHSAPLRSLPERSNEPLDFGIHQRAAEGLRYTVYDLVALSAEDKSFRQLKSTLRQNGAVTNEMLKQGLPLFLHKNRSTILRRYFRELDKERAKTEKRMSRASFLRADASMRDASTKSTMSFRKSAFGFAGFL